MMFVVFENMIKVQNEWIFLLRSEYCSPEKEGHITPWVSATSETTSDGLDSFMHFLKGGKALTPKIKFGNLISKTH